MQGHGNVEVQVMALGTRQASLTTAVTLGWDGGGRGSGPGLQSHEHFPENWGTLIARHRSAVGVFASELFKQKASQAHGSWSRRTSSPS